MAVLVCWTKNIGKKKRTSWKLLENAFYSRFGQCQWLNIIDQDLKNGNIVCTKCSLESFNVLSLCFGRKYKFFSGTCEIHFLDVEPYKRFKRHFVNYILDFWEELEYDGDICMHPTYKGQKLSICINWLRLPVLLTQIDQFELSAEIKKI